ncbi:MAG: hypothetical protein JWM99_214 [Verrucomicrobiales bacterium]|nr:hypothetical protein [Verrucomicrobiales bacterium]
MFPKNPYSILCMTMNRGKFVGIVSFGVVVLALLALFAFYGTLPTTKIQLQGPAGVAFEGKIKADGRELFVTGQLPAEFVVPGRKIECSFSKTGAGKLVLRIYAEDGVSFHETYNDRPNGGVQGEIHISQVKLGTIVNYTERGSTVTTFDNPASKLERLAGP